MAPLESPTYDPFLSIPYSQSLGTPSETITVCLTTASPTHSIEPSASLLPPTTILTISLANTTHQQQAMPTPSTTSLFNSLYDSQEKAPLPAARALTIFALCMGLSTLCAILAAVYLFRFGGWTRSKKMVRSFFCKKSGNENVPGVLANANR